ncbi:MAG: cell division protein ZapD [Enterovibrio sp.]
MSSETFYEFPLNPNVRTYLRVESLFRKLNTNAELGNETQWTIFFHSLFQLCDLLGQIHVRGELAKDLLRQREKLIAWRDNPYAHIEHLDDILQRSHELQQRLLQVPRLGQSLRDDVFLTTFRQKFDIPAGVCPFDAPHLHHWLHLPKEHLLACTRGWLESFQALEQALNFWLQLTRQGGIEDVAHVKRSVFQYDAPDGLLVQIKIPMQHNFYPMINSYKSRFTLRLVQYDEKPSPQDIVLPFTLC